MTKLTKSFQRCREILQKIVSQTIDVPGPVPDQRLMRPGYDFQPINRITITGHVSVKEAVLPFNRFPDADPLLGPEMRSTGEVMGIDATTGLAFTKSQMAAGGTLPKSGTIFMSLADRDKPMGVEAARIFADLGFSIVATPGTADALSAGGVEVTTRMAKVTEDDEEADTTGNPTAVDLIDAEEIDLVINSPRGRGPRADGAYIRAAAGAKDIPLLTTGAAALAAANGMADWLSTPLRVRSLQDYHAQVPAP